LAASKGIEVSEDMIFTDSAVSGSKGANERLGIATLVKVIEDDQIDILFLDELSRLSRELIFQQIFLRTAQEHNVRVIDAIGFDSAIPGAKLMSAVRGAFDENALKEITHRARRGRDGSVLRGYFHGRAPYGYRSERVYTETGKRSGKGLGTKWIKVPEQADVIKRIFTMRSNGLSYLAIAKRLTTDNIPSPSGGTWGTSAIQQILKRPIYIGHYSLRSGSSDIVEYDHPELAIVEYGLYKICQPEAKGITTTGRGGGKLWASGLVVCSCGHKMTAHLYPGENDRGRIFCYHCFEKSQTCNQPNGSNSADLTVLRDILHALISDGLLNGCVDKFKEHLNDYLDSGSAIEIKELKASIKRSDASLKRLAEMASTVDEKMAVKALKQEMERHSETRRIAAMELATLERLNSEFDASCISSQIAADLPDLIDMLFDSGVIAPEELRAVLHRIFPRIVFEGRESRRISFWAVEFSPSAALAFLTNTKQVSNKMSDQVSLRVFSSMGGHSPTKIEILPFGTGYHWPTPDEKRCARCATIKNLDQFSKAKSSPDGISVYCRTCSREKWKAYAAKRKAANSELGKV